MRPQHILKTRNRSMTLVVALGTAAALVTGGGAGALASSATISRMGGHNTALQGTVAHAIIEFFPAVPEAHTWHQSWTDAADGLDKEVIGVPRPNRRFFDALASGSADDQAVGTGPRL